MEDVVLFGGFFGTVVVFLVTTANLIGRWKEAGERSKVMLKLVDSVAASDDPATALESSTVTTFLAQAADRRTVVLNRVIRSVQAGIILLVSGFTLFILRSTVLARTGSGDQDAYLGFTVLGTLALALGIAFFLAAGASFVLSSRWGLIDGSAISVD